MSALARPQPPIFLDAVLDDPAAMRPLLERHAPYGPVQRYMANDAEYGALSGRGAGPMIVAPNFRGDWAYDTPLVEGIEPLLHHPAFRDAAARLLQAEVVRPQILYTNLTYQLPFDQGAGHVDVPAFRGFDRTRYPVWLLNLMGQSRLFERWRVDIVTAVAWFYEGTDGGFTYWPDGPDAPPQHHEGAIHNTAAVGDNDFMFHRVRPVGRRENGLPSGLTLDSRLVHRGGDDWAIEEGDATLAELDFAALRVSLSWKAQVFRDAAEAALHDEHRDDLDLATVVSRLCDGLGLASPPADPLHDPAWVEALTAAYATTPRAA